MLRTSNCETRKCKHLIGVKADEDIIETSDRWFCEAFPDGVPKEIAFGDNDHTEPFDGDNGIQFEAEDESPEQEGDNGKN